MSAIWGRLLVYPSILVTDSFIVVTLKSPDIQRDWALITRFLLMFCLSGGPPWFHPSEAFHHALHGCIPVLRALRIEITCLFSAFYCQRSPCRICHHNKGWFHVLTPRPRTASATQGLCRDNNQFWSKPRTFHSFALKGKGFLLPVLKGRALSS